MLRSHIKKAFAISVTTMSLLAVGGCANTRNKNAQFAVPHGTDVTETADLDAKASTDFAWYAHCSEHKPPQCGRFSTLGTVQRAVRAHNDYYHQGKDVAYFDNSRCQ